MNAGYGYVRKWGDTVPENMFFFGGEHDDIPRSSSLRCHQT